MMLRTNGWWFFCKRIWHEMFGHGYRSTLPIPRKGIICTKCNKGYGKTYHW
jgi:hypothetical protein